MGHLITNEGLQVDPEKTQSITQMTIPQNVDQLRTFLGFTNYLSKFIPDYSKTCEPLRQLLKKETAWHWEH